MLPSSLMLLNTAHEYLGRRSWCCNSDGALLRFYVSDFPWARAASSGLGWLRDGKGRQSHVSSSGLAWLILCIYNHLPENLNLVSVFKLKRGKVYIDSWFRGFNLWSFDLIVFRPGTRQSIMARRVHNGGNLPIYLIVTKNSQESLETFIS